LFFFFDSIIDTMNFFFFDSANTNQGEFKGALYILRTRQFLNVSQLGILRGFFFFFSNISNFFSCRAGLSSELESPFRVPCLPLQHPTRGEGRLNFFVEFVRLPRESVLMDLNRQFNS
jgi:hypothetical protein